jgi:hypothetical protein
VLNLEQQIFWVRRICFQDWVEQAFRSAFIGCRNGGLEPQREVFPLLFAFAVAVAVVPAVVLVLHPTDNRQPTTDNRRLTTDA